MPYDVVLHGAEVTVPGRLPGSRAILAHVLRRARRVVTAGGYPAAEGERAAERNLDVVNVPPGVDVERFRPLDEAQRTVARARFGLPPGAPLVVSVSRLVPRKGFDTLIRAAARLRRTRARPERGDLRRRAGRGAAAEARRRARCRGHVPRAGRRTRTCRSLYGGADVFAMVCRSRWAGLEQEGFGIVFLEAAACGVPQVAGASGGAAEAVLHGETGLVVDPPDDPDRVADALATLLDGRGGAPTVSVEPAEPAVVAEFTYDRLAHRLGTALGALP